MGLSLDNFVRTTVSADIGATDTTIVLAKAAPPLRDPPAATADAPGVLVLMDTPTAPTVIEIVTYTGRTVGASTVTLTGVVRGIEGTQAAAWASGTPTYQGITAGLLIAAMAAKADVSGAVLINPSLGTSGAPVRVPRTFVQSADPAVLAVDGDLWVW